MAVLPYSHPTEFEQSYQIYAAEPNLVDDIYEAMLKDEKEAANSDDLVTIGHLSAEQEEYDTLATAGVSIESIQSGEVARGRLQDAGFVFLNRIGGGEKPLISAALPNFDASRRVLLTADELGHVTAHQRDLRAEHGIADTDLERIRKGMLGFLLSAVLESSTESQKSKDLFLEAQRYIIETHSDEENTALAQFMVKKMEKEQQTGIPSMRFLMQQCVDGTELLRVSNVPIEVVPSRFSKLSKHGSPYLDSGVRFGNDNFDTTLYPNDRARTRRINVASIHLLSRGIDEMGTSRNGSHDQTYLTAAEYVAMAHSQPRPEATSRAEQVDLVATRLLAAAGLVE